MPIDDIAAVLTPPVDEHESTLAGRSTCPPEELRIHAAHTAIVAPSSRDALSDDVPIHVPAQQPTPPPTDDPVSPARTRSSSETHPKPIETSVEDPIRDIPTPMSTLDDGAEEPRHAHVSPLSATAPTTTAWSQQRYPTPPYSAHRVCCIIFLQAVRIGRCSQSLVSPQLLVIAAPPRQSLQRKPNLRSAAI